LTFAVIFQRQWTTELVLTAWVLMTASIPLHDFNTKTRCDLLEMGYWVLSLYEKLLITIVLPEVVTQKVSLEALASRDSNYQLRDGLNTFRSLISIIRESPTPKAPGRIGSGPLEYSFGHVRIQCRDVKTMDKMLKADRRPNGSSEEEKRVDQAADFGQRFSQSCRRSQLHQILRISRAGRLYV
jgi:hypothetical protein